MDMMVLLIYQYPGPSFGGAQNSLSGNRMGASSDQRNRAAVAHPVTILTQTEGQPTSTNFPLSPTEVDHPVRSIAEYILAREKMRWKKEYEYDTGLDFSFSSFSSSLLSNGSRGFPEPSFRKPELSYFKRKCQLLWQNGHNNTFLNTLKSWSIAHPQKFNVKPYLHVVNLVGRAKL